MPRPFIHTNKGKDMPSYLVALVLKTRNNTYADALKEARSVAERSESAFDVNIWAETVYEQEKDGQRILHLPPIN